MKYNYPPTGTYIGAFRDEYRWLSNFWPVTIVDEFNIEYPSVENAYQASKIDGISSRKEFAKISPGKAKKLSREFEPEDFIENFHNIKVGIMKNFLDQKFAVPELRELLKNTYPIEIIEGNNWGDTFWGVCKGEGHNNLGKLLMSIRLELL